MFVETAKYYQEYLNNAGIFERSGDLPHFLTHHPEQKFHEYFIEHGPAWLRYHYLKKIYPIFSNEYDEAVKSLDFFWGCDLKLFKEFYSKSISHISNQIPDANEIDIMRIVLNDKSIWEPEYFYWIYGDNDNLKQKCAVYLRISTSRRSKLNYLNEICSKFGYKIEWDSGKILQKGAQLLKPIAEKHLEDSQTVETFKIGNELNWAGTYLELSELIKSLIECKKFIGKTDKEVFDAFMEFLNIPHDDQRKKDTLATIRKRTKDKMPFLNQLSIHLEKWIDEKDN